MAGGGNFDKDGRRYPRYRTHKERHGKPAPGQERYKGGPRKKWKAKRTMLKRIEALRLEKLQPAARDPQVWR